MSQENVEVAKQVWDALKRKDIDAFLEHIDPDVEFTSLVAEVEGTSYRGHEGVRQWWDVVAESLGGLQYETEEFRDLGDMVLTNVVVVGNVGGVEVPQKMWHLSQIRDGKAVGWSVFRTEEEALEAAARSS